MRFNAHSVDVFFSFLSIIRNASAAAALAGILAVADSNKMIGDVVRSRRKFLRLRQRDLAEMAEVTLRSLSDIESGRGNPTLSQLSKISAVLGMEVTLKIVHDATG